MYCYGIILEQIQPTGLQFSLPFVTNLAIWLCPCGSNLILIIKEMAKTTSVEIPDIKDILKSGLQFGHSTSRWNPRMAKFIFGAKNNIHIIDVIQTKEKLAEAVKFVEEAATRGNIMIVGTKRQAAEIIEEEATRAGAFFITNRWAGGLFTNHRTVGESLKRLLKLEEMFKGGVEGRTKYEVSRMKVEWQRLNRLFRGVKTMTELPTAVIVVDPRYEKVVVKEARKVRVPIIALADTNCDPRMVDYIIPGNDDAIGSIKLIIGALADAILIGNKGKGVKHDLKDFSKLDVEIKKAADVVEEKTEISA